LPPLTIAEPDGYLPQRCRFPELLEDITHPDRIQIREIVRSMLPVVTLSTRADKALKVDFKFPDNSHLVYEGVMKGKEKTFNQYRTAPDGQTVDNLYNKIGKVFSQAVGESMTVTDPYHAAQRQIVAVLGLPDLNGKEFFGKR